MENKYKTLFDKLAPQKSDDELLRAVLDERAVNAGKKKRFNGKAVIIPAAAATAFTMAAMCALELYELHLNGATTNVSNNVAVADGICEMNSLLKPGTYYLNGDVNAELWVEVTPDYITLKGTDVDKSVLEFELKEYEEGGIPATEDRIVPQHENDMLLFCAEHLYQLEYWGLEDTPYVIKVDRNNLITDREALLTTNAGFRFNDKTNTIDMVIGEFTLVE